MINREDLEEQHAISKEIASALTQGSANAVDDDELESELADLQQEELDNKMLNTGTVPVHDQVNRLPNVATGEGMLETPPNHHHLLYTDQLPHSQGQGTGTRPRGRRRRGRATETAGRDGHVVADEKIPFPLSHPLPLAAASYLPYPLYRPPFPYRPYLLSVITTTYTNSQSQRQITHFGAYPGF